MLFLIVYGTFSVAEVSSMKYWKSPFLSIATAKQFQEYLVMEVDFVASEDCHSNSSVGALSTKVGLTSCAKYKVFC